MVDRGVHGWISREYGRRGCCCQYLLVTAKQPLNPTAQGFEFRDLPQCVIEMLYFPISFSRAVEQMRTIGNEGYYVV